MSTLAARAQALIDAGYKPVPVKGKQLAYAGDTPERDYNPAHFQEGMRIQVRAGHQPDGTNLYGFDLEGPSHGTQYNADRELAALCAALPHIAQKLRIVPSTNGDGRWLLFRAYKTLHSSQLFDGARKIGDFIGIGGTQRVPDPGDEPLAILTLTEIEHLLSFWTFNHSGHADDPRHWTNRAAEGKRYVVGYTRHQVKRAQLRTFLREQCGKVGAHLDALFTEKSGFDRSAAAGNLMQTLFFHIHKIAPKGSYSERCALAYAYWLAADSYGKAADKDYNQQKDGCALLAAILHEDCKLSGGNWRAPFWAKAHPTPTTQPEPEPTPARRAPGRPAGPREKQIERLKHILARRWNDDPEYFYYFNEDLDNWAARCGVKRRAIQNYLKALELDNQIKREQEGGPGGRPKMTLLPAFWDANNSEQTTKSIEKSAEVWGANGSAIESISTPQNADTSPQCKGDHQNLCAPAPEPEPAPAGAGCDQPKYSVQGAGAEESDAPHEAPVLARDAVPVVQQVEQTSAPAGAHRFGDLIDLASCREPEIKPRARGMWLVCWPDGRQNWYKSEASARTAVEWDSTEAWLATAEGQALFQRCAGGVRQASGTEAVPPRVRNRWQSAANRLRGVAAGMAVEDRASAAPT